MANGRKFVFNTDEIRDVEPEELNEPESVEKPGREIDGDEVEDVISDHAANAGTDNTNPNNTAHPEPEIVDAETVTGNEETDKAGSFINGKMLIFMLDTVVPLIIKYGGESVNKKIEIDLDALKMDEEEKELLGPSAEHVADLIFGKLGPIAQFFVGYSIIMAGHIPDAIKKKE